MHPCASTRFVETAVVSVVERGSIAAAARAGPLAPAAVSKRMSELEATRERRC